MNKEEEIKYVEGIIKKREELIQEYPELLALHNSLKSRKQLLAELKEESMITLEEFASKVSNLLISRSKPATCINACEHAIIDIGNLGYRIKEES